MDFLPVSIPPAFWYISFLANIVILASVWFFKTYLPARDARKKIEFEADQEAKKDERVHYQKTGNVFFDTLREMIEERSQEVNEIREEHRREVSELIKAFNRLDRQVESLAEAVVTLAGAIDQLRK